MVPVGPVAVSPPPELMVVMVQWSRLLTIRPDRSADRGGCGG